MSGNILNEDKSTLLKVLAEVKERDGLRADIQTMKQQRKRLLKQIQQEEKSIKDETLITLKKRKMELEDGYDRHLDKNRSDRKSVIDKKEKKKTERMNQRVKEETRSVYDEIKGYEADLKGLFRKNKVPSICSSKAYYALFAPSGFVEKLKMALILFGIFAAFPFVATLFLRGFVFSGTQNMKTLLTVLVPAIWIIVCLLLYFLIYIKTKIKHLEVIEEGRKIRDSIKACNKKIKAIDNSIKKDQDESVYKLDAYDKQVKKLDKEADSINEDRKNALKNFDEKTKSDIVDEINGRRKPKLEAMKKEKAELEQSIKQCEAKEADKSLKITNKYATYVGEDFCKADKLNDLLAIMEEHDLSTIGEAIAAYKGQR